MGATETKDRGISWERLNDRQKKFVEEYLKDYNGKRAAIAAGYKPTAASVRASQLLSHPLVKQAIGKGRHEDLTNTKLDREKILEQLYYNVVRDPLDLVDEEGFFHTDVNLIPERMRACIDRFKVTQYYDEETGTRTQVIECNLTSKLQAIDLAMKHKGLFAPTEEKVTHLVIDFDKLVNAPRQLHEPVIEAAFRQLEALPNKSEKKSK